LSTIDKEVETNIEILSKEYSYLKISKVPDSKYKKIIDSGEKYKGMLLNAYEVLNAEIEKILNKSLLETNNLQVINEFLVSFINMKKRDIWDTDINKAKKKFYVQFINAGKIYKKENVSIYTHLEDTFNKVRIEFDVEFGKNKNIIDIEEKILNSAIEDFLINPSDIQKNYTSIVKDVIEQNKKKIKSLYAETIEKITNFKETQILKIYNTDNSDNESNEYVHTIISEWDDFIKKQKEDLFLKINECFDYFYKQTAEIKKNIDDYIDDYNREKNKREKKIKQDILYEINYVTNEEKNKDHYKPSTYPSLDTTDPLFGEIETIKKKIKNIPSGDMSNEDKLVLNAEIDEIYNNMITKGYTVGSFIGGSKKSSSTKKYKIIKKS
jgi:hypothetical protein